MLREIFSTWRERNIIPQTIKNLGRNSLHFLGERRDGLEWITSTLPKNNIAPSQKEIASSNPSNSGATFQGVSNPTPNNTLNKKKPRVSG